MTLLRAKEETPFKTEEQEQEHKKENTI